MKIFGIEIKRASKRNRQISNMPRQRLLTTATKRSYDAAAVNRHTAKHFLDADGSDADSLIREALPTLRNRARYEIRNNPYASGMTETKADDMIGTGPRLQVQTGNPDLDRRIEDEFGEWCLECDAGGKMTFDEMLRLTGSLQMDDSGESILIMKTAPAPKNWTRARPKVQLRLLAIEPDRLVTPWSALGAIGIDTEKIRNGVECDENGRPLYYYILKKHPGSTSLWGGLGMTGEYDKVPAEYVIHLFRQNRPGQTRGVPWITPSIPLFGYLRRYTLATVAGAETAADISAVLETESEGTETDAVEAMDEVEIARNSMLTLPAGTKMSQFKPEQPSATYKDFKHELINEMARPLKMPFNVAAGNSAKYNYASGRLDKQGYYKAIRTTQSWIERKECSRVFFAWLREAMLIPGMKLAAVNLSEIKVQWFWPGIEHVDPVKEAAAQDKRLKSLTTNLSIEYAKQGLDWEREIRQRVKEIDLLKELGILDEKETKKAMEDIARGVRAGVPIGIAEARTALGLAAEPPDEKLLRFNDQDVLQYHIESGILTINEVRSVLGLPEVDWGNVPVRKQGLSTVSTEEKEDGDIEETEEEKESE
ncbi:MAG: phage portal protein [Phycisphaerae bacterium]|nr:phage portal protein [Phycisphaerae bacterium]NIS53326.1 phage portal protein [Phycisphaerae bacterium]NIX30480.1 phage portal protein [Phycisphaerae bacterium]